MERDDPGDDRRRDRVAGAREGVGDALGEATPAGARPARHGTRRRRECRAFADAQPDAGDDEPPEAIGEAGEDGRKGPDEAADSEGETRPEAIPDPAPDDLEAGIAPAEGGEDGAVIGVAEVQLALEHQRGGR